jgi:phosphoglycerate dehydrogenase-like enzyme
MPPPIALVTETEYRRAESTFSTAANVRCIPVPGAEAALCDAIREHGARFVVVGSVPYQGPLYATLPAGGVIARFGVGYDSIDRQQATAAGLLCTNTPDVLQQSVAELTMVMIGAAARHFTAAATTTKAGQWAPRQGTELEGKTLTLVGCGAIARAVARIAAAGYGMRVIGFKRSAHHGAPDEHFSKMTDDFASAVRAADFVSLHIPSSPENVRFVSRERLAMMRPEAWIVNTARGAVVDEAALYDALAGNRLGGAALDVFEREPYQPVEPARDLRTLPNVILVPHIGSNTAEANRRMALRALRNVALADAGDLAAMDVINPDVLAPGRRTS